MAGYFSDQEVRKNLIHEPDAHYGAGYDIELTKTIAENVSIPVIASGGAGRLEDFNAALTEGRADAPTYYILPAQTEKAACNMVWKIPDDMGCRIPNNGYLKKWADQGVLLLNTVLTVRAHQADTFRSLKNFFTSHISSSL